jgi:hypothetical protein
MSPSRPACSSRSSRASIDRTSIATANGPAAVCGAIGATGQRAMRFRCIVIAPSSLFAASWNRRSATPWSARGRRLEFGADTAAEAIVLGRAAVRANVAGVLRGRLWRVARARPYPDDRLPGAEPVFRRAFLWPRACAGIAAPEWRRAVRARRHHALADLVGRSSSRKRRQTNHHGENKRANRAHTHKYTSLLKSSLDCMPDRPDRPATMRRGWGLRSGRCRCDRPS